MRKHLFLLCLLSILTLPVSADGLLPDSLYYFSKLNPQLKKHPWKAGLETVMTNVGVWSFDRFVMNEEFARINIHTIRSNVKNGFVWDNDQFSTNLFAHPYHGGLYFNTARSNGLSFWESVPYSFAGSLMWEVMAEREPPAINDLIATTCGGVALGEVTNRLSALVLDESKGGIERVGREVLGFVLSPMRGLNRLMSGQMWKRHTDFARYHDEGLHPVRFSIGAGNRYLADDNHWFKGEQSPYIQLSLEYGDLLGSDREYRPYDYFSCSLTANLAGNQPLIGSVNLKGCLLKKNFEVEDSVDVVVGLFQHFNYYDSEPVIDGTNHVPFKISEAASFGPGIIYRIPMPEGRMSLEQHLYASAVLLGGSLTDYYQVIDRNYNMGSGYSLKSQTRLDLGPVGYFTFLASNLRIFTWKGYSDEDLANVNPLYLNAQGDKGNASLTILQPDMRFRLSERLNLGISALYYLRHTHYSKHPDKTFRTFETRLGLYLTF